MNNPFTAGALMIGLGSSLFFEIVHRKTPFNQYKFSHPINIVGNLSFFISIIYLSIKI